MTKRLGLYCGGCLIIGLAVGYLCGRAGINRRAIDVKAGCNMVTVATALREANKAYRQESRPVAVYALTRALDEMKLCEEYPAHYTFVGEPFFMTSQQFAFYMMMTHARLAEIYGETGQTNVSQQHIVDMLNYAREGSKCSSFTNDPALMEFVNKHEKSSK